MVKTTSVVSNGCANTAGYVIHIGVGLKSKIK